jgi:hypothetical protein
MTVVTGPRTLKTPRSPEYAIQTMASLKRYLRSQSLDADGVRRELGEIEQYKHWQILGFPTLNRYLQKELGWTKQRLLRRLTAQEFAADPTKTKSRPNRGRPRKGEEKCVNNTISSHGSTNIPTLIGRLKRDAPAIAEALARGEYRSARAAAIAAGIPIRLTFTVPADNVHGAVQKLITRYGLVAVLKACDEFRE